MVHVIVINVEQVFMLHKCMQASDRNNTIDPAAVCTYMSTLTHISCLTGKSSDIGKSRWQGAADAKAAAQAAAMCLCPAVSLCFVAGVSSLALFPASVGLPCCLY